MQTNDYGEYKFLEAAIIHNIKTQVLRIILQSSSHTQLKKLKKNEGISHVSFCVGFGMLLGICAGESD